MEKEPVVVAINALRKSTNIYRQKVNAASPYSIMTGKHVDKRQGPPAPGSLADDRSRMAAGKAMINCLVDVLKQDDAPPWRRWYLVSICTDEGRVPLGSEDPVHLKGLIHKVYKAMTDIGLHGIGVVELAPFRKSKLHPKMLFAHPHCVVWSDDQTFKPRKAAEALMASTRFPNSLGLPSVTIISRKKSANLFKGNQAHRDYLFSDLDQDQTENSMAWMGYYLWQAPSYVKHAYKPKSGNRRVQLRTGVDHYSPKFAATVQEVLNRIPTIDAVFGIGDGKKIRAAWKKNYVHLMDGPSRAKLARKNERKRRKAKKVKIRMRQRRAINRRAPPSGISF